MMIQLKEFEKCQANGIQLSNLTTTGCWFEPTLNEYSSTGIDVFPPKKKIGFHKR